MVKYILALCLCMALVNIANAGEVSIYSMVVGNEIWELSESRQLTFKDDGDMVEAMLSPDGKYVAYLSGNEAKRTLRFCTVKSSGEHSKLFMEGIFDEENGLFGKDNWIPCVSANSIAPISWSPDSRLIAIPVRHVVFNESGWLDEEWVFVYTPSGIRRKSFQIPTGLELLGQMLWSPDSHRFAVVCQTTSQQASDQSVPQDISNHHAKYNILIFDAVRGSMQTAVSNTERLSGLEGWSNDGKSLRYLVRRQLCEVRFDGKPGSIINEKYEYEEKSPGGVLQLVTDRPKISVKKCATGEIVDITKSSNADFGGWTSDGKMIVYSREEVVSDEQNVKREPLHSLWLASTETHKLSHMCLALDLDGDQIPTWSNDCMKVAYLYRNRLYLSELKKEPLTSDIKLEAGLKLSEEEEKDILLSNAKQIGTGLAMFNADWDGKFPSADDFLQELTPYLKYPSVFFRPGTEQVVFRYFPPETLPILNPAETVMGEIDIGYGWKIVLYADGHASTVRK